MFRRKKVCSNDGGFMANTAAMPVRSMWLNDVSLEP